MENKKTVSKIIDMPERPKGRVIIHKDVPATPDDIVRGIFGISLNQLVKDIQTNADGRYDSLYTG